MGLLRMGPPVELVMLLRNTYKLERFIETGTYYGNTAIWAAQYFESVITIERAKQIYDEVSRKNRHDRIDFLFGDTRHVLKTIVPKLTSPSLFWLDAHWSGGATYGDNDECPLLEELEIIEASVPRHFVLVDDARLFMSPPPRPHDPAQWPDIASVMSALRWGRDRYVVIIEDVVVAVPGYAKPLVVQYCQDVNTKAWLEPARPKEKGRLAQNLATVGRSMWRVMGPRYR